VHGPIFLLAFCAAVPYGFACGAVFVTGITACSVGAGAFRIHC
jgi:hypothetical protein